MTYSAVLGLAVVLSGAAQGAEWTKEWRVSGQPEIHVRTGDVSVEMEAGGSGEMAASLTTRGWSIGPGGLKVIEHQDGNRVDLEIREPESHFSFGDRSATLRVRVPRGTTAEVEAGDGSIHLTGLAGSTRVRTGDGSIQGSDLDGSLEANTGDGSVHVAGRFEKLRLKTNDGSVDLRAVDGSRMAGDWRVETGDGSVHVSVPHDLAADLRIHTGDGSIHCDLPLTMNRTGGEHDVAGKLNGGGSLFEIHTGDGSVSMGAN